MFADSYIKLSSNRCRLLKVKKLFINKINIYHLLDTMILITIFKKINLIILIEDKGFIIDSKILILAPDNILMLINKSSKEVYYLTNLGLL